MSLVGELNENITLAVKLWDGATNQYPRAVIYTSGGTVLTTKNLSHVVSGNYTNMWSTDDKGYYIIDYVVYSDSAHTTKNTDYSEKTEDLWVTEAYGGGGAGKKDGGTYLVYRKGPWTHDQRDKVLQYIIDSKKLFKNIEKNLKNYHKEEITSIDNLSSELKLKIDNFRDIINNLRKGLSEGIGNENVIKKIEEAYDMLDVCNKQLMKKPNSDEIEEIMLKIDELDKMITKIILSDMAPEELDSLVSGEKDG